MDSRRERGARCKQQRSVISRELGMWPMVARKTSEQSQQRLIHRWPRSPAVQTLDSVSDVVTGWLSGLVEHCIALA